MKNAKKPRKISKKDLEEIKEELEESAIKENEYSQDVF